MLARLDEKLLDVQIVSSDSVDTDRVTALGQSVHLIVEEGLEAYLPMADMIDYAKERVSLLLFVLFPTSGDCFFSSPHSPVTKNHRQAKSSR